MWIICVLLYFLCLYISSVSAVELLLFGLERRIYLTNLFLTNFCIQMFSIIFVNCYKILKDIQMKGTIIKKRVKTIIYYSVRSSHWRYSIRKGVLKNLAKLTGKRLCQSLFFNKPESCNLFKNFLGVVSILKLPR